MSLLRTQSPSGRISYVLAETRYLHPCLLVLSASVDVVGRSHTFQRDLHHHHSRYCRIGTQALGEEGVVRPPPDIKGNTCLGQVGSCQLRGCLPFLGRCVWVEDSCEAGL